MRLVIRGPELSNREREALEFRVRLALSRFAPRLVRIHLDRRPPGEGARADPSNYRCRLDVVLEWSQRLELEETDFTWPEAASRVLDRSVRILERRRELGADHASARSFERTSIVTNRPDRT